ncbi:hypothetical protein D3C85_1321720 [compost metagenome]
MPGALLDRRLDGVGLGRFGNPGLGVAAQGTRFAIQALQVGTIEVVPATGVIATALIGTIAAAVIAFTIVTGQQFVGLGQGFEHPLASGDVGPIDVRGHGVDP